MSPRKMIQVGRFSLLVFGFTLVAPSRAIAHCDGLDGPVVKAAQKALDTRNAALALVWVQSKDEAEIRAAFARTLAVRALSPQARELADRFFFETLVRVHRAGENAPFTGLKPAGRDLGPAIPAADKAVHDGAIEPLVKLLTGVMQDRLREHFNQVVGTQGVRAWRRGERPRICERVCRVHALRRAHLRRRHGGGARSPARVEVVRRAKEGT